MSESRQRFTGRVVLGLGAVFLLWLLFVTLPLFTSNLQVTSIDPRWLTPADLTWQRIVFNLLSKPGFRLILVGFCAFSIGLLDLNRRRLLEKRSAGTAFVHTKAPYSLEWVIEGSRQTAFSEYALFVGVI